MSGANTPQQRRKEGILTDMKVSGYIAMAYAMLYGALTLAFRHSVQIDWLLYPLLALGALAAAADRLPDRFRRPALLTTALLTAATACTAAWMS